MARHDPARTLAIWTERDLTAEALAGQLPPAFQVEDVLEQVADVIASGHHPILVGESGVGKTAAVYELVRRASEGGGPERLRGRRILQLSLRRRMSALRQDAHLGPELQTLAEALASTPDVVPFIRDVHIAYVRDLEPQLQALAYALDGPILAEGVAGQVRALFETSPELEEHYVTLGVEEPNEERLTRILEEWARWHRRADGRTITPDALAEAIDLSQRFLVRGKQPRKALELLSQVKSVTRGDVGADDVRRRFCASHKVPRLVVDPQVPLDLTRLERTFRRQLLGQEEAVQAAVRIMALIKAGLSDPRRPLGAFLFVGPTGVGKTHLAQLLAQELFGSADRLLRLNMADYPREVDGLTVFGDSTESFLWQRRGLLTTRIVGNPFAVLLLDEFEKAHASVHDRFLQLFDEGCFINGAGETVSCRSTILIATSNAGAEVYRSAALGFGIPGVEADRELDRRLAEVFRPELLNRFDQVIHFHPLRRDDIRTIALRELEQLQARAGLRQRGIGLDVDEDVLDWLVAHGYDPHHGARYLKRTMERHLTTAVADALVRGQVSPGSRIQLGVRRNRIVAAPSTGGDVAPPRETVALPTATSTRVRRLDVAGMRAEASRLLAIAAPRLRALEDRKRERTDLLARMNAPGFWDDARATAPVLERYRELDVAVAQEERLAGPLRRLEERMGSDAAPALSGLLQDAARALHAWERRDAEEGAAAVWLLIERADALRTSPEWLETLTEMELAWCRRLHLTASVAAYEILDGELSRVVLEIEGPGAEALLAAEPGVHRWHGPARKDAKARVHLIPRSGEGRAAGSVRAVRPKEGLFRLRIGASGRLELPGRGVVLELVGEDAGVLAGVLGDLSAAFQDGEPPPAEVARVYGEAGSARDPRTGATVARLKDVLRGKLDTFVEAWRSRSGATPPDG